MNPALTFVNEASDARIASTVRKTAAWRIGASLAKAAGTAWIMVCE
jgi:hypothetical protein